MSLRFVYGLFLIGLGCTPKIVAQDTLSLNEAIRLGLESNLSIVLAKNNLEIAKNNNTWESTLPQFGINGSQTNNITESYLQPFSGPVREGTNLKSTNLNASAMLNWTVFDGMNMFVTKEKMVEYEKQGEVQTKIAVENLVAQVIMSYYSIVLQHKMLLQLKESVKLSQQRKKIMESRYAIGTTSGLALSQAQVDLNADSSALMRQELAFKNAVSDLNRLTGRAIDSETLVSQAISIDDKLKYEELFEKIKTQNSELLLSRQNERIAELSIGQVASDRYPKLSLFGGYNYNRNTAAIGFAQVSRNTGPTYGATMSWNLYGGGSTNRAIQNAKIQKMSQEAQRKDIEIQVGHELYKVYNQYLMNLSLMSIENKNLSATEFTIKVAMEKYAIGSLTDLELRDVQNSYLDASSRLLSAIYQAKLSETELLKISGQVVR